MQVIFIEELEERQLKVISALTFLQIVQRFVEITIVFIICRCMAGPPPLLYVLPGYTGPFLLPAPLACLPLCSPAFPNSQLSPFSPIHI